MIVLGIDIPANVDICIQDFEPVVDATFKHFLLEKEEFSVGITLTDDHGIQQLNSQYRGFDRPTDVLSFEAHEFDPDTETTYLGDIIISYETAQQQAERANHSVKTEILLLTMHGLLHIMGFDHDDEASKDEMWQLQAELLSQAGVFPKKLPED
jgi:probable rRNA maturation factor